MNSLFGGGNSAANEAKYKTLFKMLDKDNSGKIDKTDLSKIGMFAVIPKATIASLIGMFDKSGDGGIDYNEFKQAMKTFEGSSKK